MRKVKIGLIGCGTVGGGVVKLLFKEGSNYQDRFGPEIELAKVCSRTKSKITALGVPEDRIVDDYRQIIDDPEIDIVVELVGGTGFAGDVVRNALKAGKNVVTANKALLAEYGEEIFHLADSGEGSVSFEAAVGGGIPIVDPLKRSLVGNRINYVMGILNGTTNYMLTRMANEGLDYASVLADAQRLGYAEADPTADVEGHDAAAKIALLSSMVFNSRVNVHDVYTNGISTISPVDFKHADHMGYVIKLLAIGRRTAEGIDVRVHPAMLPKRATPWPLSTASTTPSTSAASPSATSCSSARAPARAQRPAPSWATSSTQPAASPRALPSALPAPASTSCPTCPSRTSRAAITSAWRSRTSTAPCMPSPRSSTTAASPSAP